MTTFPQSLIDALRRHAPRQIPVDPLAVTPESDVDITLPLRYVRALEGFHRSVCGGVIMGRPLCRVCHPEEASDAQG